MDSDSASSTISDPLDMREDEGYEDIEPDQESVEIVGLFNEQTYPDARSMLRDCKEKYSFDFIDTQKRLDLDFYGLVKLVNYIRSEVKSGNQRPDVTSKARFDDDKYLQPVLEDDALLFSLDELLEPDNAPNRKVDMESMSKDDLFKRVNELTEHIDRVEKEYAAYKEIAEKTLDQRWNADGEGDNLRKAALTEEQQEGDKGYFSSYSFTDIHESMIKDSVRTDAYRSFIENHPELFSGKTVLDIGCGSGILSLFCVRAGAAKVIAVDNSDIIQTARLIVNANGYDDKITCVRGKIEEVTLPVQQVDIIVSEWMGYGLLFEGMFDSVLWARDRYLKPGGLMVPSHCSLHLAAIKQDSNLEEKRKFWTDVYGFNMLPMIENDSFDKENVRIEYPHEKDIARPSCCILDLNAHTAAVADLSFKNEFCIRLDEDIDCLAGWLIWFDIVFMPDSRAALYKEIEAAGTVNGSVAFTTGPDGPETHWKCAFMATHRRVPRPLENGTKIIGHVQYEKAASSVRGLEISIDWEGEASREKGNQKWILC